MSTFCMSPFVRMTQWWNGNLNTCTHYGETRGDGTDIEKQVFIPDGKYHTLAEAFEGEYAKRMNKGYTMMSPSGLVPLICIHDMKVFMWNVDTGETYAPTSSEDIDFCNVFIQVMKSERSQDRNAEPFRGRFDEIERLNPEESK